MRSVDAIAAIQRTIREVGEITAAIAAAVTEQGAATREIARSAETASRRTNETADEVGARQSRPPPDTRQRGRRREGRCRASRRVRPTASARRSRASSRSCGRLSSSSTAVERRLDVARQRFWARPARHRNGCRRRRRHCWPARSRQRAMIRRCWRGMTASAASSSLLARLHLDEHQRVAPPRHDVDLAHRAAPAPPHDAIALGDQVGGGAAFRRQAERERDLPVRARRCWRLAIRPPCHRSFASSSARE